MGHAVCKLDISSHILPIKSPDHMGGRGSETKTGALDLSVYT